MLRKQCDERRATLADAHQFDGWRSRIRVIDARQRNCERGVFTPFLLRRIGVAIPAVCGYPIATQERSRNIRVPNAPPWNVFDVVYRQRRTTMESGPITLAQISLSDTHWSLVFIFPARARMPLGDGQDPEAHRVLRRRRPSARRPSTELAGPTGRQVNWKLHHEHHSCSCMKKIP